MRRASSEDCLDEAGALLYLSGSFSNSAEAHLEQCSDCRALLLKLAQLKSKTDHIDHIDHTDHTDQVEVTAPVVGAKVERYVILEELGRGGMGVVMSAYDPVLDRKVALKLVKPSAVGGNASERLLREAQTLAKVTHPNVIQVYDAGRFEDRVFLAMEEVKGPTLRGWLKAEERASHSIVRLMIDAGEGLAAAHAAGVIHGDFKPENVLVSGEARTLVTDFGLARWMRGTVGDPNGVVGANGAVGARPTIGGTPGYMAPEQYAGRPVDEWSDQFAFCVALYEALCGQRPYTPGAIARASTEGALGPPELSAMPRSLRAIILRGLSVDPKARYRSMRTLLFALIQSQSAPRKRWFLAATSAAVLLSIFITHQMTKPACVKETQAFESVWSPARATQLRDAFLDLKDPYSKEAAALVTRKLDRYKRTWDKAARDVCEEARGTSQVAQAKLKRACLQMIASEAGSLVTSLLSSDAALMRRASSTVDGLTSVADCKNASFVAQFAMNSGPALTLVKERLTKARETMHSGSYEESITRLRAVLAKAKKLQMASLAADASLEIAELQAEYGRYEAAEKELYKALVYAERAKHDPLRAQIMLELASVTGIDLSKQEEGYRWLELADAILAQRKDASDLRALHKGVLGSLLLAEAKGEEAVLAMEAALRDQPIGHPERHQTLRALGAAHGFLANNDLALDYYKKSLEGATRELGSEHPDTATVLSAIADFHAADANYAQALADYKKALSIWETAGVEDARVALAWAALGQLALDQDDFSQAALYLKKGFDLRKTLYTDAHPDIATSFLDLSELHSAMGAYDKAASYARDGVGMFTKIYGPSHLDVGVARAMLGDALLWAGDLKGANKECTEAMRVIGNQPDGYLAVHCLAHVALQRGRPGEAQLLFQKDYAMSERVFGPEHWELAFPEIGLGLAHLSMRRAADAKASFARALKLLSQIKGHGPERAKAEFALARALHKLGDKDEAVKLAEAAQRFYQASENRYSKDHAALKRWLTRLGR